MIAHLAERHCCLSVSGRIVQIWAQAELNLGSFVGSFEVLKPGRQLAVECCLRQACCLVKAALQCVPASLHAQLACLPLHMGSMACV